MAFGSAMALAMSTTGLPVTGLSSEVMPKYFTPMPGKYRRDDEVEQAQAEPGDHAGRSAPAVVARFHQMPMTSAGKLPAIASENAQPTMARMSDGLGRRQCRRGHGHEEQQDAGDRQPPDGRRIRVEHLVVDVVAERVGDGEQQPVGGGERGGETAGGHQARDHVRKARDLRRGEHDHVRIDHEVLQPDDAGMTGDRLAGGDDRLDAGGVLAADLDQAELAPGEQPGPDRAMSLPMMLVYTSSFENAA